MAPWVMAIRCLARNPPRVAQAVMSSVILSWELTLSTSGCGNQEDEWECHVWICAFLWPHECHPCQAVYGRGEYTWKSHQGKCGQEAWGKLFSKPLLNPSPCFCSIALDLNGSHESPEEDPAMDALGRGGNPKWRHTGWVLRAGWEWVVHVA